ncbi:MAG: hypothetical protein HUK22_06000, partial [Thermoguttaceae bacterium]|nr:hypothetical protein [Thermoguttaceae bacterium]
MSAPEIAPSPEKSSPKRPFWRKKRYWVPAALVALVYCLYCVPARLRVSPETTGAVEPLTADGKCVDYAKLYLDAQDAYLGEPTANGFRELLTAFGPLVLEQKYAASRVPWEKFPTDETTAKWFAGYWTRLCEKYAVDPAAQPTFLRRLDLFEHLKLYGATGEETPDVDPETAGGEFEVWVDCEPRVGKLTSTVANDAYCRLLDAPWTAEEFPAAARWMEENADVFDV